MKTIITTVGISLFENYQKYNKQIADLSELDDTYSDSEWTYSETLRKEIRDEMDQSGWLKNNPNASAEIKSLLKIKERLNEEIHSLLVTSDTLKGYFAGDLLCMLLNEMPGISAEQPERIPGFDVSVTTGEALKDEQKMKDGIENYIEYLITTTNQYEAFAGYNISGGFKAMIPITTMIASLKHYPVFYIYEKSEYLIQIPPFPFTVDLNICKTFYPIFKHIEDYGEIDVQGDMYKNVYSAATETEQGILTDILSSKDQSQEHLKTLSATSEILWEAYKESTKAVIFTEGKTDWKHVKKAYERLGQHANIRFREIEEEPAGDKKVAQKCQAFAEEPQPVPLIFMFDNDNETIKRNMTEDGKTYKSWGNNVSSFTIPIPEHRKGHEEISIEFYYTDEELRISDESGRRLFLSSEFDPDTGTHCDDQALRLRKPGTARAKHAKIVDSNVGVLNKEGQNVALSKAQFAENILKDFPPFDKMNFEPFRKIFDVIEEILSVQ